MMKKTYEHYVTIFNSAYLPQGIALYLSMERQIKSFKLWVICVDDKVYDELVAIALPKMGLIKLSNVETNELLKVKKNRTIGEYCWTLTPFAPRFVFEADETIERVTYVDADLWFINSPTIIFNEFEKTNKTVMITNHHYAAEYDQSNVSGIYCVQFIIFCKNKSENIRRSWEEKCLDWCYARIEEGKFGDQKYLDEWPKIYPEQVHIIQNKSAFLAPWNATRFPYSDAIIYHFHGLKILSKNRISISQHNLPDAIINCIYKLYIEDLRLAFNIINKFNIIYTYRYSNMMATIIIFYQSLKRFVGNIIKLIPKVGLKI